MTNPELRDEDCEEGEVNERERAQFEAEWLAQNEWNDFTNWLLNVKIPQIRQASAREQMERDAAICNSYSSGNHRHVADAIRESFEREAGKPRSLDPKIPDGEIPEPKWERKYPIRKRGGNPDAR